MISVWDTTLRNYDFSKWFKDSEFLILVYQRLYMSSVGSSFSRVSGALLRIRGIFHWNRHFMIIDIILAQCPILSFKNCDIRTGTHWVLNLVLCTLFLAIRIEDIIAIVFWSIVFRVFHFLLLISFFLVRFRSTPTILMLLIPIWHHFLFIEIINSL